MITAWRTIKCNEMKKARGIYHEQRARQKGISLIYLQALLSSTTCLILLLFCIQPLAADTFTFKADRMSGSRALGRETTILIGGAEVRSDNLLLRADRIEIHGDNNRYVECIGNVWGHEEDKNILFYTDRLSYDRTLKIAKLEGNSTLEDRENEIVARGRFIEYDDQNEITIFQIAVRLFKDDMVCRSEYAIYRRQEKLLDLSGFPIVYKNDDEFRADKIRVDLDTDDVMMEGSVSGTIIN